MTDVALAPMRFDELDEVAAIEAAVSRPPWTRGHFADSLQSGYPARVCRVDGALAAYSVLMPAADEAHLLTLGVAASYQRRGLGAMLLDEALRTAKIGGAQRMLLEVRPSNVAALALYRRFGFREIGRRRGYYSTPGAREDALVLARDLGEETGGTV